MNTQTKESQNLLTPDGAKQLLIEGNNRFVAGNMADRNLMSQVNDTIEGQYPHSAILSCIDSRTSSELIFDQGIGDVFNARVAGNIVNEDVLGSLEYSCKVAGSKLLLVLGHSKCGAVTAACKNVEMGNITALLSKVKPAIAKVSSSVDDITAPDAVQKVADENVMHAIDEIRNKSQVLAEMEKNGEIKILGGMYDIETGKVSFFE